MKKVFFFTKSKPFNLIIVTIIKFEPSCSTSKRVKTLCLVLIKIFMDLCFIFILKPGLKSYETFSCVFFLVFVIYVPFFKNWNPRAPNNMIRISNFRPNKINSRFLIRIFLKSKWGMRFFFFFFFLPVIVTSYSFAKQQKPL